MTLAGAKDLPRMPWERPPVKGNKHQTGLRAGDQECAIIKAQP